jgi:hypothetical protein
VLLGYASKQIQKVCEEERAARKHLPQNAAGLLPLRLSQLAAFRCLKDVPSGAPFVPFAERELVRTLRGANRRQIQNRFQAAG